MEHGSNKASLKQRDEALPLINGKPVDLRPAKTYQSPYLNADFGSDKISVSIGPEQRLLDFSK